MNSNPNGFIPPVPRDQSAPTVSELVPFKSTKINIWKSKALVPLMLMALTVIALFSTMNEPFLFMKVMAFSGITALFLGVYYYSGMRKQFWWYLAPALACWALMQFAFGFYAIVFRDILPGNLAAMKGNNAFIPNFVTYFFAAGLCEELVKATPVLIALVLALRLGGSTAPTIGVLDIARGQLNSKSLLNGIALRGPLDGMLMGFASGAAFILYETLGQYVINIMSGSLNAGENIGLAWYKGLSLLLPRIFQGVSGHMAWAAIFGYFIGLASKYPSRWMKLILIGYLVPAVLHGLWDSVDNLPFPTFFLTLVSIATVLIFVACLLKAKQLELAWGSVSASNDSILVGDPTLAPIKTGNTSAEGIVAASPAPSTAVGGFFSGLQGLTSSLEAVAGGFIKPVAAPPMVASQSSPDLSPVPMTPSGERFSIGTGSSRFALEAGRIIDFGALFGGVGAPLDAKGEISRHPKDPAILGLKNIGSSAWTSTTADGATVAVPPGKNLRISAGTNILFGQLAIDIQAY